MKLRNLFTDDEVLGAMDEARIGGNLDCIQYAVMARCLSAHERGDVTRQLARYWARQFETTKKNGDYYITLARANRELKDAREIRAPKPSDQLATDEQSDDSDRILFFTDSSIG